MKRTNVLFCFFFATLSLSAQSKIIVGQEEAWGIVKQSVLGNKIEGINVDVSSTVLPPASIIKTLGKDETSPGCVATAVAMIASYWRYPKSVGGMTLNWDLMTSTRSVPLQVNHLSDMAKQVAKLMQVIGEESNMNYGCDESGTDIVNGKNWLINHGYTGGNETGYNFSTAISSLKNGSPILMGGFDTKHSSIFSTSYSGGHAWVVDGYAVNERKRRRQVFVKKDKKTGQQVLLTDNYYTEKYRSLHNNWGFDGVYNGWFPEGCFDIHSKSRTQNITRSGVEGNYQYKNSMFVNLKHVN